MKYVQGLILHEPESSDDAPYEFIEGYLGFEDGVLHEISGGSPPSTIDKDDILGKGIIIPTLINPHTHIGDSIAKGFEFPAHATIESLFAPPDGLKHKLLRAAQEPELIAAMRDTQREMLHLGISGFCDFREEGLKGVLQLKAANEGLPIETIIFGRPKGQYYDKEELDALLQQVDGIGISSISDYEYSELEKISKHTRSSGKRFALHASERIHEDLDRILNLKPDFIIHMTKGTSEDFEILAAEDVPVILCPRSNRFFGNTPDISGMLEKKVTIGLGTDNVMLNPPGLFHEMRVAYDIVSAQSTTKELSEIFKMGVINFRKILNHKYNIPQQRLEIGQKAKFILIEIQYNDLDPTQIVVNKINKQNISVISIGNEFLWCRDKSKHKL